MKTLAVLLSGIFLTAWFTSATAETDGNVYLGFSLSSLALDGERIPGVPTRSPGHTPKLGSLLLGYQFNDRWSADLSYGTDISNNVDANMFSLNGYRFFGDKSWKPFISAGVSSFGVDAAPDDRTQQIQAGVGVSGALTDNLELRIGYQHFFDLSNQSYNDDGVNIGLNWHFGKTKVAAGPAPVAQAESVPMKKEVVDTFEILVQFDLDKSDIKAVFKPHFDKMAQVLKESPDISITVEGHTCWLGTEEYNQGLSERRAEAVKQLLVREYGVSADKIDVIGYGETRPVADNNTKAGREKNRRAIAVILRPHTVTE